MSVELHRRLAVLLTGLFALAIVAAPTLQARAHIERAVFAANYAMPDGTLPTICGGHDQPVDQHRHHTPDCSACVLMASPALSDHSPFVARRLEAPGSARFVLDVVASGQPIAWAPHRARAPPAQSIT